MWETSGRLLRLLSLLQARRDWTGAELAERLDVTTRTIRKDVDRLRGLGYPVEARPGPAGGYRLGDSGALPPLLLDEDEAVAVAVGLRVAASSAVAGLEEASVRALATVQRTLPSRLRRRVEAFRASTLPLPTPGPRVDAEVLVAVASACRDHECVRFDYATHTGATSRRLVEPHRLVTGRGRWYLVAWDRDRADWRTFRVDRIVLRPPAGPRFAPRPLPPDDELATRVADAVGTAPWRYRARVVVHAPAEHVVARLPVRVRVTSLGPDRCVFEPGSDDPASLALHLALLDADFEVQDAPELADALRSLAARFERAAGAAGAADSAASAGSADDRPREVRRGARPRGPRTSPR